MANKHTTESFKEAYYNKFPDSNVDIIGDYVDFKAPIKCKCKDCGCEWTTSPRNLLRGNKCRSCSRSKYNTESFKETYYNKYPDSNVKIIGKYVNAKTKIDCTCKKCGHNWTPTPNKLLIGQKCPKCTGHIKYDPETFLKLVHDRYPNSNVNIVDTYVNARTPIKCICKKCNLEWLPYPSSLLKGTGCPKCAGTLHYNTESFKEAYYKRFPNSNVLIIGKYTNSYTHIDCKCKKCGWEWSVKPNGLMDGRGCPQCAGKIKYTTESFKKNYYKEHPDSNIEIIGEYINNQTSIKCKCRVCGYEWTAQPQNLHKGSNCIVCIGKAKYDTESFKRKFYKNFPDTTIEIIGEYVNISSGIACKCLSCGYEWKPRAKHLMDGHGCPRCSTFKTEKSLGTFLDSLGISYTAQKKFPNCKYKKELPFDYEINDKRFTTFLLEYQGHQHDHPVDFSGKNMERAEIDFEIGQIRDKIKYDYCQKTARHLEYIWYYEEDKIQALIDLLRKYIKPEYDLDKILANAKLNKTA